MADVALRAFALLLLASALAPLLRRSSPAARHLYWHAAIVATLALPLVAAFAPAWSVRSEASIASALDTLAARPANAPVSFVADDWPRLKPRPSWRPSWGGAADASLASIAKAAWLAGTFIVAAYFTIGYLRLARIRRRARPATLAWTAAAQRTATRVGLRVTPEVLVSDEVEGPMTTGWLTPVVLLPDGAGAWSSDRRDAVVAHELSHVARRDCRTQLIAQAVCAMHWFNPLAWRAAWQLQRERERACDAEVLRLGITPSTYASELLAIASGLGHRRAPVAALAMARRSELEGRLLAVLAARAPRRSTVARLFGVAAVAILSVAVAGARVNGTEETRLSSSPIAAPPIVRTMATGGEPQPLAQSVEKAAPAPQPLPSPDQGATPSPAADQRLEALLTAITDRDAQVREKAALAIGFWADDRAGAALMTALTDPDGQVREKAAIGLALRRRPGAIGVLVAAMKDPDPQVREKVAIALGASGEEQAWPALGAAVNDPDPQVREKVVAAMVMLRSGSPGLADSGLVPAAIRVGLRLVESFVK